MNVKEIAPSTAENLSHYFETAAPLTLATVWIVIAFQSKYIFGNDMPFWKRLGWPVLLPLRKFKLGPYRQDFMLEEKEGLESQDRGDAASGTGDYTIQVKAS